MFSVSRFDMVDMLLKFTDWGVSSWQQWYWWWFSVGNINYSNFVDINNWNHLVITNNINTWVRKVYINWILVWEVQDWDMHYLSYDSIKNQCKIWIYINDRWTGDQTSYFNWQIDEIAVFNKVLNADEAGELYNKANDWLWVCE